MQDMEIWMLAECTHTLKLLKFSFKKKKGNSVVKLISRLQVCALSMGLIGGLFAAAPASAQGIDIDKNPFVNFYKQRVAVSTAEALKQQRISAFEKSKWVKLRSLAANGAVPQIEADNQETVYKTSLKTTYILEAKIARTRALYEVARLRVSAGLDMPICSDPEIPGAVDLPFEFVSKRANSTTPSFLESLSTAQATSRPGALENDDERAFEELESPYITIYGKGLEITLIAVERQRIVLANEQRNLERYRYLLNQRVISQQIFDEHQTRVNVALVAVDDLRAKAAQQQALYDIVKLKVDNGLEVAVCPEGD